MINHINEVKYLERIYIHIKLQIENKMNEHARTTEYLLKIFKDLNFVRDEYERDFDCDSFSRFAQFLQDLFKE